MKITNRLNLPRAFVSALENDPYDIGSADISVTSLIGPPQIRRLRVQHEDELEVDASELLWALEGQASHAVLAQAQSSEVVERRLYSEFNSESGRFTVSGQMDNLELSSGTLSDYKRTSVWTVTHGPREDWVKQLNIYAELARRNKIVVRRLQIVATLRDWSRAKHRQYPDTYPPQPVVVLPVPLWDESFTQAYVNARLDLHFGSAVPDCTPQERWEQPGKWALMKDGRQSAIKLEDSEAELSDWAQRRGIDPQKPPHSMVHRPGVYVRCEEPYCPVRHFCPQLKREGIEPG